jgi:xanthine dehydrogenase YagS FAD-binding subunit
MQTFELTRVYNAEDAVRAGSVDATEDAATSAGSDRKPGARDASGAASQERSTDSPQAMPGVRFLAGGTTLLDLMKLDVEQPRQVIDIGRLPLADVETLADGGLKIGAMVRNADLAHHPRVLRDYPVLSQALLAGASAQLRNMATTGGNLLQRTRCVYFRDTAMACNKRRPGSGCAAIGGYNRNLAILGASDACIASNPSDMNVALAALEATIHVLGAAGERAIPIADFYLLPGDTPQRETALAPGDLITHVSLAAPPAGAASTYLKLRDRASYEFALSSAAVVMTLENGRIGHARVALGGVGTRPWRSPEAEAALAGQAPDEALFALAAKAAVADAVPQSENGFKIELIQRCLISALKTTANQLATPAGAATKRST